jgi:hypothetical protein
VDHLSRDEDAEGWGSESLAKVIIVPVAGERAASDAQRLAVPDTGLRFGE